MIQELFDQKIILKENFIVLTTSHDAKNQSQTNDVFSDKWEKVNDQSETEKLSEFQQDWFLKLYGFESENALASFLQTKKVILDAGCGLGYKAAWFAKLAPGSTVIGMDFSTAAQIAADNYKLDNLFFIQGDIADTNMNPGSVDFVCCDQVIMHTENPEKTFEHLSELLTGTGEFACYVYAKKALPRELLDDYFRSAVHNYTNEEIWQLSEQLTELGKRLSELNVKFESPEIPLLGIKGGEYDIQRFLYWNFIKCFWKEDWGYELSNSTNFDWYSPSNAKRYNKKEFEKMISSNHLAINYFHEEEACYSGRFKKG